MYRERSGELSSRVQSFTGAAPPVFVRPVAMEILQGSADEAEWCLISEYLADQKFTEMTPQTWADAARIYFDLRRIGKTVRSSLDCCIAQLALENNALLLHCDHDFEIIASIRPLIHRHFDLDKSAR
jgi:predicted nucleic acid-binding protein